SARWTVPRCARTGKSPALPANIACSGIPVARGDPERDALTNRFTPPHLCAFPRRPRRTIMSDWQRDTRADYQRKGFASRSGYGRSPAFVIVDFINGFTDPTTPLGGDFAWQINATRQLLDAFRLAKLPVFYTTVAYAEDMHDAGVFAKKV